jgi:hypothetical protein
VRKDTLANQADDAADKNAGPQKSRSAVPASGRVPDFSGKLPVLLASLLDDFTGNQRCILIRFTVCLGIGRLVAFPMARRLGLAITSGSNGLLEEFEESFICYQRS